MFFTLKLMTIYYKLKSSLLVHFESSFLFSEDFSSTIPDTPI